MNTSDSFQLLFFLSGQVTTCPYTNHSMLLFSIINDKPIIPRCKRGRERYFYLKSNVTPVVTAAQYGNTNTIVCSAAFRFREHVFSWYFTPVRKA